MISPAALPIPVAVKRRRELRGDVVGATLVYETAITRIGNATERDFLRRRREALTRTG